MVKFLDLPKQYNEIKSELDEAIADVISKAAFIGGPHLKSFEDNFASYLSAPHCIGVGNGTDAIEIALEALNLPANSEVIAPAMTFIASTEAITRAGHKVVFCDVNEDDYTINLESLRSQITLNTKAILAVHLYGHPCDMNGLKAIAREFDLKIIEDCAQAHGSEYEGVRVGCLGDAGCFSFYPGKNLGAYGDGGAVVCKDEHLAKRIRMIANHGRISKYDHEFEGRNSRLDSLQCAILDVKLKHLETWVARRIAVADVYLQELSGIEGLTLPTRQTNVKQAYHLFVVQVPEREAFQQYLKDHDIHSGIHYPVAMPKLSAYNYLGEPDLNMYACKMDQYVVSIPIGDHMSEEEALTVVDVVKSFFGD
jgi:dTDP-4-amino-4,6-dideoxygalactose transaminase